MSTTKYLQASFRGAPFFVENTSDEGGPRSIIHEYPGRSDVYAEPSGHYPRRFEIDAHLIGDNFEKQLQTLESALNVSGPGKLVHPHRGDLLVVVDGPYRVQRNTRELGVVRVVATFCETIPQLQPRVTPDTGSATRAAAVRARVPLAARVPDVSGPDFLTAAVRSLLSGPKGFVYALSKVNNRINSTFGLIDEISATIDDFTDEVVALSNAPATLGVRIQDLVNSVLALVTALDADEPNRGDALRNRARVAATLGYALTLGKFGDNLPEVDTPTPTRQQQADNQAILVDTIETAGLIGAVEVLTDLPFDNSDQAGEVFEAIRALFERIEDRGTLDDESAQALADLRAAFFAHLCDVTGDLPGLGRYTPPRTVPVLVLAYRLYGDSSRADVIIVRNPSFVHPGYIQGGVELSIAEL